MFGFPTTPLPPRDQIDPEPRFVPAPFAGGDAALGPVQTQPPSSSLDSFLRFIPSAGPTVGPGAFGSGPFDVSRYGSNGFGLGAIFSAFATLIQSMFALIAQAIGSLGAAPSQGCRSTISTNGCPPAVSTGGSTRSDGNRPIFGISGDGSAGVNLYGP